MEEIINWIQLSIIKMMMMAKNHMLLDPQKNKKKMKEKGKQQTLKDFGMQKMAKVNNMEGSKKTQSSRRLPRGLECLFVLLTAYLFWVPRIPQPLGLREECNGPGPTCSLNVRSLL
jgi:hypothetical protein